MAITDYSTTPSANTTISGINIAEGCNASNVNDAIRQMMADIASGNRIGTLKVWVQSGDPGGSAQTGDLWGW